MSGTKPNSRSAVPPSGTDGACLLTAVWPGLRGGNHQAVVTALTSAPPGSWRAELVDVVRGMSGGLLFGVPLLYTMEVWWTAEHTTPWQGLGILALSIVPIAALNRTAGFRVGGDATWRDSLLDAVEALGIAVILAAIVLTLLREITAATPLAVMASKVTYEALPFGLGVAVANHFLSGKNRSEGDDEGGGTSGDEGTREGDGNGGEDRGLNGTVADLGATLVGAAFIALNIAPTEEVPMLAAAMGPPWLIALVAFSLVVTYAIVFVAGFSGQEQRHAQQGVLQRPLTETMAAYLVALLGAVAMLWVFQQLTGPTPWLLAQAVVLAFPASVGGAAGRLAI